MYFFRWNSHWRRKRSHRLLPITRKNQRKFLQGRTRSQMVPYRWHRWGRTSWHSQDHRSQERSRQTQSRRIRLIGKGWVFAQDMPNHRIHLRLRRSFKSLRRFSCCPGQKQVDGLGWKTQPQHFKFRRDVYQCSHRQGSPQRNVGTCQESEAWKIRDPWCSFPMSRTLDSGVRIGDRGIQTEEETHPGLLPKGAQGNVRRELVLDLFFYICAIAELHLRCFNSLFNVRYILKENHSYITYLFGQKSCV